MKEKNFISAVVYVRNNENNIDNFIDKLYETLDNKFLKYEIIFVNDNSNDSTVEKIKEHTKKINNASVSIINMSFYQGKEISMNAGIDLSIGDFVYQFDSTTIDKKRRYSSALFYKIFNKYSNFTYKIDTESFQIISRRAINRIYAINKTVPYRKAIQANSGLKIANINYKPINNEINKIDKKEKKERSKNAINSLVLFTDISYKITFTFSILMLLFIIAVTIYTIVIFLTKNPVEGWTPTMLFIASGFFGIFLILTIIIKYLSITLNLIFKKSDFLVESIEKIK